MSSRSIEIAERPELCQSAATERVAFHRQCWEFLGESQFKRMLSRERKRAERSDRRFLLLLLHAGRVLRASARRQLMPGLLGALSRSTRETDLVGWHQDGQTLGIIFTETHHADKGVLLRSIRTRVTAALHETLETETAEQIPLTFHFFPESGDQSKAGFLADASFYPDTFQRDQDRRLSYLMKRVLDVTGSFLALVALFPLLLIISLAIKLTSKGPVFFRQERVGRFGSRFTMLKFRTMKCASDPHIHHEYVKQFIAGIADGTTAGTTAGVYKIQRDPRITSVGTLLRKTSMDELPQFLNVLKGEMSLVGPRPPITYEVEEYQPWHLRRVLETRPGITGLWQVNGRSRLKFDDMVRLDVRYVESWNFWLDIKILLQTPRAVLSGVGAC